MKDRKPRIYTVTIKLTGQVEALTKPGARLLALGIFGLRDNLPAGTYSITSSHLQALTMSSGAGTHLREWMSRVVNVRLTFIKGGDYGKSPRK